MSEDHQGTLYTHTPICTHAPVDCVVPCKVLLLLLLLLYYTSDLVLKIRTLGTVTTSWGKPFQLSIILELPCVSVKSTFNSFNPFDLVQL